MSRLGQQHLTISGSGVSQSDVAYAALPAGTEKIWVAIASVQLDVSPNDPNVASVTYDQGGNNQACTFPTGARATETFGGDRHISMEWWYLDSPTDLSAGTLRIVWGGTINNVNALVTIYSFDDEAESGSSGAIDTHNDSSADPSLSLNTRDTQSVILVAGAHQLFDANPFTPGGVLAEDYDDDVGNSSFFAGHGSGTGGSDSCGYTQTGNARRNAAVAVEVLQSTGQTAPTVALDSPADAASIDDTTPELRFTGTDTELDDIRYNVQISEQADFPATGVHQGDAYEETVGFINIHLQPTGTTAWTGDPQLDDRPGQSFTAEGGILDSIEIRIGSDVAETDGNARIRVYAHQGTYGTSSEPLNAADSADTPTPDWLAISDNVALTNADSIDWRTFNFSGADRIRLEPGEFYVFIIDWVPSDSDLNNYPNTQGHGDLGHGGNAYIDGDSVNNGIYSGGDMVFRVNESVVTLDKVSGTDAGFANIDTPADTDPFNSGDQVGFTVQAGDALTDGVTYFWRARGIDPSGSGAYGSWATAREFTVELSGALVRVISETVNVGEDTLRTMAMVRVLAEAVNLAEVIIRARTMLRFATETANIQETSPRLMVMTRPISETVNLSETSQRVLGIVRAISETVNIQETSLRNRAMSRIVAETVDLQETVSRVRDMVRINSDAVNFQETTPRLMAIVRAISDTINISETNQRVVGFVRMVDEATNIQEGALNFLGLLRVISETANVQEGNLRTRAMARVISETVNLVETVARARDMVRVLGEAINLQETSPRLMAMIRAIDESVEIRETIVEVLVSGVTELVRIINEDVQIDEATSRILGFVRVVGETVQLAEGSLRRMALMRIVSEAVNLTEGTHRTRSLARIVSEAVNLDESPLTAREMVRLISETLNSNEDIRRITGFVRVISETVNTQESLLNILAAPIRAVADKMKGMFKGFSKGMR